MDSSAHGAVKQREGEGCLLEVSVTLERFENCYYLLQ